jgi:hypothetical protein
MATLLARVRHEQGRVLARMEGLGLAPRREASMTTIVEDVVKSSSIEGEHIELGEVRSSWRGVWGWAWPDCPRRAAASTRWSR